MAQNIYDDPDFFAGYAKLGRSQQGLDGANEWPTLRALLSPMQGLRVLDLGCGYGWFCRWARMAGAASVLGLDISERMLATARRMTDDAAITYRQGDLDTAAFAGGFDLAFSSLTLHYIEDLPGLLARLHAALAQGGRFVFSMEHPLLTAPSRPGFIQGEGGGEIWPLDNYLVEGPRRTDWITSGVLKQHRTVGTMLNALIGAGFAIAHVEEWGPSEAQIAEQPALARERARAYFLLISATRDCGCGQGGVPHNRP